MVDDLVSTVARLESAGVEIVAAPGVDPYELTAWFRDPAGNVLGIYQEPAEKIEPRPAATASRKSKVERSDLHESE